MVNPRSLANLRPRWKPGEPGNPAGHSRDRRKIKALRQCLREAINIELPEDWVEALNTAARNNQLDAQLTPGMTVGEALALRIVAGALRGEQPAIDQILSSEPRVVDVAILQPEDVAIPDDAKRLADVVSILRDVAQIGDAKK